MIRGLFGGERARIALGRPVGERRCFMPPLRGVGSVCGRGFPRVFTLGYFHALPTGARRCVDRFQQPEVRSAQEDNSLRLDWIQGAQALAPTGVARRGAEGENS